MGLLQPGRRSHPADGLDAPRGVRGLTDASGGPEDVRIRRIRADDADGLRTIRLRAVIDAPYAFTGTISTVGAHPRSLWEERARTGSDGPTEIVLVAERSDTFVGMAGALTPDERPSVRRIHGVWVDPAHRGAGVGRALVRGLLAWADAAGVEWTELWVAGANGAAETLYRSLGFEATGRHRPFPPDEGVVEREYRRYRGAQPSRSSTV